MVLLGSNLRIKRVDSSAVEQLTVNQLVVGSNPSTLTNGVKGLGNAW